MGCDPQHRRGAWAVSTTQQGEREEARWIRRPNVPEGTAHPGAPDLHAEPHCLLCSAPEPPLQNRGPPAQTQPLERRCALGGNSINPLVAFRVGVLQKLSRKKYGPKVLDVGAATDGPKPAFLGWEGVSSQRILDEQGPAVLFGEGCQARQKTQRP